MMQRLLEFVLQYGARDERGAEMVEWVVWVGLLAVMGGAVIVGLQAGLAAAIADIVSKIAPA